MLAKLTILSAWGDSYYAPVDSLLGLKASKEYIINTDNIVKSKLQGTTDSQLLYKLNKQDDEAPELTLLVDEADATITTYADTSPASQFITLAVYEGATTFGDVPYLSTVDTMFRIDEIVWCNRNEDDTATRILVCEGGFTVRAFWVNQTLDRIIDLADTGTSTTTTSSTSTTTGERQ